MKIELQDLQPMLEARSEETDALTKIIEKESLEVDQVRKVVQADEAAANEAAMSSKAIKVCGNHILLRPHPAPPTPCSAHFLLRPLPAPTTFFSNIIFSNSTAF